MTGAARGIGAEIARVLAESGADPLLLDVDDDVADTAASIAESYDVDVHHCTADVSDYDALESAIGSGAEALGPPTILVNNAAITTNVGRVVDMAPEQWRREIDVNLTGAFYCAKLCLEHMREAGYGRIVNMSSGAGEMGGFGQASYASSKAGLLGLTKTLALEHATDGVTANAVLPGLIRSPASEAIRDDMLDRIKGTIPTGKRGEPVDVATAVNFLASEQAGYVNGSELNVDAGQRLFVV